MTALVRMLQTVVKSSACFDEYELMNNAESIVLSECLSTSGGGFLRFYCRNRKEHI